MAGQTRRNVRTISQAQVEKLTPGERLWDDKLAGFCVRCQGRSKIFGLQARIHGRQRWLTIGKWGVYTPDEARQRARALLGRISVGEDVAAQRERIKALPTIDELADYFLQQHVRPKLKPRSAAEYERLLTDCILSAKPRAKPLDGRGRPSRKTGNRPRLGQLRADALTTADVVRFHNGLRDVPYEANRALAVLSKLLSFAEQQGIRPRGSNPCRGVAKFGEHRRERFLLQADFAKLADTLAEFEQSGRMSPFIIAAIRLLILTGARRDEVRTLKWSYIDFDRSMAFLPDSKTGRKALHLSAAAMRLLSSMPRMTDNPYVFVGGRSDQTAAQGEPQPIRDLQGPWESIRELAGFRDLRLHDLRHSYASVLAASGTPLVVVGRLLGHRNVTTTARYAHLSDDPLRAAAEQAGEQLSIALPQSRWSWTGENETAPSLPPPPPLRTISARTRPAATLVAEMSPQELLHHIRSLPARQALTEAFEKDLFEQGVRFGDGRYKTQKQHWVGWLSEYDGPGYYGRIVRTRSARYAYNHVVCPPMVLWLAEASGVDHDLVGAAMKLALAESHETLMQRAAAVRQIIPWHVIERRLIRQA